jgi:hypothetical protein
MQVNFGVGNLTLIPPSGAADPTPLVFGVLQDVQLDYASSKKTLYGQRQFAVAVADAEAKLTGKAKFAQVRGGILAAALVGSTTAAGETTEVTDPTAAIPATPFQITVAGAANFVEDLGVVNAATNAPFTKVASAPAAGQYSVNAATGVYTFASADNVSGISVKISYTKTVAAVGKTISLANPLMGISTTYVLDLFNDSPANSGKIYGVRLSAVVIPKLSLAWKNSDFTMHDVDFEAIDDGTGSTTSVLKGITVE